MPKRSIAIGLFTLTLIPLAGCTTSQELRARDEATCTGYGFQPGATEFATCLQRESLSRRYQWNQQAAMGWFGPSWRGSAIGGWW